MNAIQTFQSSRAVEIVAPKYGAGYIIGLRLVLTCAHLFDGKNDCKVRFRLQSQYLKKNDINAKVIWKAPDKIDIALVELPEEIKPYTPVRFGQLPNSDSATKVEFDFLGWPKFVRYSQEGIKYATGLHIEGIIDVAHRAPSGRLLLNINNDPAIQPTKKQLAASQNRQSPWEGISGAAILCNGLVVGVQSNHPITDRPESLEAESLAKIYSNEDWRRLLKQHGIDPEPKPVVRNQALTSLVVHIVVVLALGLGGLLLVLLVLPFFTQRDQETLDGFWATKDQQKDIRVSFEVKNNQIDDLNIIYKYGKSRACTEQDFILTQRDDSNSNSPIPIEKNSFNTSVKAKYDYNTKTVNNEIEFDINGTFSDNTASGSLELRKLGRLKNTASDNQGNACIVTRSGVFWQATRK